MSDSPELSDGMCLLWLGQALFPGTMQQQGFWAFLLFLEHARSLARSLCVCVCVCISVCVWERWGRQISEFVFIHYFTLSLHNSLKENNSLPSGVDSWRLECERFKLTGQQALTYLCSRVQASRTLQYTHALRVTRVTLSSMALKQSPT